VLFNDSMTMFMEQAPTVPFVTFDGPALIAMSQFKRKAMCHKAIHRLRDIKRVMNEHSIPMGSLTEGLKKLPYDVLDPMLDELGDRSFAGVIQSLYRYGHPRVAPKSINYESKDRAPKDIVVKRMHIMFYDPETASFKTPDIRDKDYGHLFYCKEDVARVGAKKAQSKRGVKFAEFVKWRKKVWRTANKLAARLEVSTIPASIGTASLTLQATSRISVQAAENLLVHYMKQQGTPAPLVVLRKSDDYNDLLSTAFKKAVDEELPVPQSSFIEYSGEPLHSFDVESSFEPCKVVTLSGLNPSVYPFSIDSSYDSVVFNGEPTPFE